MWLAASWGSYLIARGAFALLPHPLSSPPHMLLRLVANSSTVKSTCDENNAQSAACQPQKCQLSFDGGGPQNLCPPGLPLSRASTVALKGPCPAAFSMRNRWPFRHMDALIVHITILFLSTVDSLLSVICPSYVINCAVSRLIRNKLLSSSPSPSPPAKSQCALFRLNHV